MKKNPKTTTFLCHCTIPKSIIHLTFIDQQISLRLSSLVPPKKLKVTLL